MDQDLDFRRSRITWADQLNVGKLNVPAAKIIELLEDHMTPERKARLQQVVAARSLHLVPVLENIYDHGNVSAVMRSAEAFGFMRMCLVDKPGAKFKAANRVTRGAEKWLDVKPFSSPAECVRDLKASGYQVWATDLRTDHSISDLDWTKPTAIVLGNEKDGTSEEMLSIVDGRFRIPMAGFSQSFNISVAAALIFYHASLETAKLGPKALLNEDERRQVMANYCLRCFDNPEALLAAKI